MHFQRTHSTHQVCVEPHPATVRECRISRVCRAFPDVAGRCRTVNSGLSRRRSRVRVPSLPLPEVPAHWPFMGPFSELHMSVEMRGVAPLSSTSKFSGDIPEGHRGRAPSPRGRRGRIGGVSDTARGSVRLRSLPRPRARGANASPRSGVTCSSACRPTFGASDDPLTGGSWGRWRKGGTYHG